MTIVPPENSTPFGIPLVQITNTPARMTIHESAIACHFHLTKSKFGLLKICMTVALDGERRDVLALRHLDFVQRLRHEDRREQVDEESDRQRQREPADRAGAELEQEHRRN